MTIPKSVKIKNRILPQEPGVYLMRDKNNHVIYIGKATNLKSRVASYWKDMKNGYSAIRANRRMGRAIDEMLDEVERIDYVATDSVIEALILEANLIRKYLPRYNVREKDDKSFLYVVITKEEFPKVQLIRGNEVGKFLISNFQFLNKSKIQNPKSKRIFGPYTSASAIRAALDLIRKWFPWSTCKPAPHPTLSRGERTKVRGQSRPCFNYHIGRCPGVCVGAVSKRDYMKNIRSVILLLRGRKAQVMKNLELRMKNAARVEKFEEAEILKRKLFALQHIRDVAVLTQDGTPRHPERSEGSRPNPVRDRGRVVRVLSLNGTNGRNAHMREILRSANAPLRMTEVGESVINIFGRIEGYDISNISGTAAVGAMVVFENGEPKKSEYKRFQIKGVAGINDVAMLREILMRRFARKGWAMPNMILIDGGWGQVNVAREVLDYHGLHIPLVGIAKGFDRKQDRPVFDKDNPELGRVVENYRDLLLRVRDEAHRFAIAYHRKRLRSRIFK